jgi:hypothetical protein
MSKEITCCKYLEHGGLYYEVGESYEYYDEENYCEPYGKTDRAIYYFVFQRDETGVRMESEMFDDHFNSQKKILNKKLKKIKKYDISSNI